MVGFELGDPGTGVVVRCAEICGGGLVSYLRLLLIFFRIGVLNELAYRADFWVQLVQSLLNLGVALAGLAVISGTTTPLTRNLGIESP